ncbi:zinc finger protein 185 isoform X2 [Enoplosus armatus]|uniref:zinc finger protein 185 isoform X2 n=1 Tax=Enoplosus armatus TaxID=215367 RepID=UPI00399215EF
MASSVHFFFFFLPILSRSVDSPLSPPLQTTQFAPSEGDSANKANGEVVPPHKDAQPEGSTVETTDDTKLQAPTEELIQSGEAQPEKSVAKTTAENKVEDADIAVHQSNVKYSTQAAEVSADVPTEEPIQNGEAQPVSSTKDNPEAVCPVELPEQPVSNTTVGNKGECADMAVDQSNIENDEAKVSAGAHVEDPVAETSAAAGTEESEDTAKVLVALAVELKPQEEPSTKTDPANATTVEDAGLEPTAQPAEGSPPEQAAEQIVEAVAEVAVESSPETPAVTDAAGEETALQDRVEPVPDLVADTVSEMPTQPAAETAVKSAECTVESAASAEPVLKTRAEEVVECEVKPVDNTVVKQSVKPTPESAADPVVELNIEDAVEPVTASEAEAVQDKVAYRAIELTDALDVEPPTAVAAPEPLQDPKQSHTEETNLIQRSDTDTSETFQKPVEELPSTETLNETRDDKAVCSFCDTIIDGYVKLTFSEPLVKCHPECLKCGVCSKALGDLLTPIFMHNQVIQCDVCFAKALKT